MDGNRTKQILALMQRREDMLRQSCFDPDNLNSVPTDAQLSVLKGINEIRQRFVLGGTQTGKSSIGAREAAWIFEKSHPYYKMPDRPTHQLVIGGSHKSMREELWFQKLDKFLCGKEGVDYKLSREGNSLATAVHSNGNRMSFFSHDNAESCRQQLQGIVADHVWLDEMPKKYNLLIEIIERCKSKKAPLVCTFTPHLKLPEVKHHIEKGDEPYIKKYILDAYDNPINKSEEKIKELDHGFALMSEAKRNTYAHGHWYAGDNAVYDFFPNTHCELPPDYSTLWRHVETIDPASTGKAGYGLLAECPNSAVWYLVKEAYIEDKAGSELVAAVQKLTGNVNVVKRVSDCQATWFIKEAGLNNLWYDIPHKKTQRKEELIKNLQQALTSQKLKIAPFCEKTVDEFTSCQYSESSNRIVGAQKYHMLDALQYAIDVLPEPLKIPPKNTRYALMREKDKARRVAEAQKGKRPNAYARIMPKRGRGNRWRR